MELLKFKQEISTLKNFFETYCHNKHENHKQINKKLVYKNETIDTPLDLCDECLKKIEYSFDRLLECPHEEKPRCRSCPNPCYEKQQWKETAKIMRYSGMRLGLLSLKKLFKRK